MAKLVYYISMRFNADDEKLIKKAAKIDRRSIASFIRKATMDSAISCIQNDKTKNKIKRKASQ